MTSSGGYDDFSSALQATEQSKALVGTTGEAAQQHQHYGVDPDHVEHEDVASHLVRQAKRFETLLRSSQAAAPPCRHHVDV